MECVQKLEKIGQHISTMKSNLKGIEDKLEEKAKCYIEGLSDIKIKHSDVQESIETIKRMNTSIIAKLKISWHKIEFFNTLQEEISKLTHDYHDHEYIDYLKSDLLRVKQKVTSFHIAINGAICKIKIEMNKIENNLFPDSYKNHYIQVYTSDIPNILSFIDNSLKEIDQIKDLVLIMQKIKNQSPKISEIKSKVSGITKLNGATTTLTEAREKLDKFVKLQQDTKFFVEQFSKYPKLTTLTKYTKTLEQIINDSNSLIRYVNYSSDYLRTIGYVDNLIGWIKKNYNPRFETIKGIIHNFKSYLKVIISSVDTINKNLCLIRTLNLASVENNLSKLKVYMNNLKVYLDNVKTDLTNLKVIMNKIRKDISKICSYKCVVERLDKIVDDYIKWFESWTSNTLMINYLKSIKDRLNEILVLLKYIKDFHGNPKCIKKIQSKLNSVETRVLEVECAIEGVARNLIGYSLQSFPRHLIKIT